MAPPSLIGFFLLLSAAPCAAGEARIVVERVETSPQLSAPVLSVPLLSPGAALTPVLSPLVQTLSAPALSPAAAAAAPIPALPVPALGLAPARALPAAARPDAPPRGPPAAAVPAEAGDGAALFDGAGAAEALAEAVRGVAGRPLARGVFIQQEQEGSLIAADPRDSSGSVFRYYRPVELRPGLVAEVQAGITGFGKIGYGLRRALSPFSKGAGASWEDRKSTRLNSSHIQKSRMPSSA